MLDTMSTVAEVLTAIADKQGEWWDFADSYGEPGYGPADMVVLGNYWCRCNKGGDKPYGDGSHLHDLLETHYPNISRRLAELNVELEWSDEWWNVDGKAYRANGDSYHWQPSTILTDDGEFITIHDDFSVIVEWATNDSSRCVPANFGTTDDLMAAGFTQYEYDGQPPYESGWHPGQTDDPTTISEAIARDLGDVDVVFYLDESSQFYVRFTAWTRKATDNDE